MFLLYVTVLDAVETIGLVTLAHCSADLSFMLAPVFTRNPHLQLRQQPPSKEVSGASALQSHPRPQQWGETQRTQHIHGCCSRKCVACDSRQSLILKGASHWHTASPEGCTQNTSTQRWSSGSASHANVPAGWYTVFPPLTHTYTPWETETSAAHTGIAPRKVTDAVLCVINPC